MKKQRYFVETESGQAIHFLGKQGYWRHDRGNKIDIFDDVHTSTLSIGFFETSKYYREVSRDTFVLFLKFSDGLEKDRLTFK